MIPLADENPPGKRPYVVYGLIALNVLLYIVDVLGTRAIQGVPINGLWNFSMIPASVLANKPIYVKMGPLLVPHAGLTPQWLTIFTSMFMHGGFMHIAGNMLYLWIFGNNIEQALGHVKFFLFYLACGVIAALAHVYGNMHSAVPTVGASGAIAGVLGSYLFLYPRNDVRTLLMLGWFWDVVEIPAVFVLGVWFATQLFNLWGAAGVHQGGGVAYWAHVGGFVGGIVLILLLGGRRLRKPNREPYARHSDTRIRPLRRWR